MTTKNNGVYYTPKALADYMVQRTFESYPKGQGISILEPSCGDGVFVDAISNFLSSAKKKIHTLECVEIDQGALASAKEKTRKKFKQARFINQSFLEFLENKRKRYDLIIGNPPYVVRKRLPTQTIERCKELYQAADLSDRYFRNLWGAFLVGSIKLLSDQGVLAFVLPAELLQVKFTEELRDTLTELFERVEIVAFKDLIFENIEQDTVILSCYKKHSKPGLFFCEKKDIAELISSPTKFQSKNLKTIKNVKWTSHILTTEELNLLSTLKERINPISDYCTAVAGIVTAANNYFIVGDETVKDYELEDFVLPVIQKGLYINGSAAFTSDNLKSLRKIGKSCNLLSFSGHDPASFSDKVLEYLDLGEEQRIDQRYKCQKRSPWYSISGVWGSEGFFFKRSHLYPKILTNEAGALVTDSAYRIKMMDGYCIKSLVYSFYNSLSLSLAELGGRYYGGGVLELTPNEFKSIAIPYTAIIDKEFSAFKKEFENKESIEDICSEIDQEILVSRFGIDQDQVNVLQSIKVKLTNRRLNKLKHTRSSV